ncbi:MAG: DciA family protein [Pseudanabaenaceae cyanobacterium]
MTNWLSVKQVLTHLSDRPQWEKCRRLAFIRTCWQEIVGTAVAKQSYPTGIYREVLQVATSATWAQELTCQKHLILKKLNHCLSAQHLPFCSDVRFSPKLWRKPVSPSTPMGSSPPLAPPQTPLEALQRYRQALQQGRYATKL